jgi:hypothetical protein
VVAAIGDATCALLQSEDAPVSFVPGGRHWFGDIGQVELGAPGHVTAQRLRRVPGRQRRAGSASNTARSRFEACRQ